MKKKIVSLLLTVCMIMPSVPVMAEESLQVTEVEEVQLGTLDKVESTLDTIAGAYEDANEFSDTIIDEVEVDMGLPYMTMDSSISGSSFRTGDTVQLKFKAHKEYEYEQCHVNIYSKWGDQLATDSFELGPNYARTVDVTLYWDTADYFDGEFIIESYMVYLSNGEWHDTSYHNRDSIYLYSDNIVYKYPVGLRILDNGSDRSGLSAKLAIYNSNMSDYEFSWHASKDETTWKEISGWRVGDNTIKWRPEGFGTYTIVGKARIKGRPDTEQTTAYSYEYHPYIKGKCQMPYKGEQGEGYLIGVESYENPNQSYYYEMLILDCTLLAQGLPAWTYTTKKFKVPEGNAGWCIWTPEYGYYWTLFRVYDGNGNMIDEQCYGFANAY